LIVVFSLLEFVLISNFLFFGNGLAAPAIEWLGRLHNGKDAAAAGELLLLFYVVDSAATAGGAAVGEASADGAAAAGAKPLGSGRTHIRQHSIHYSSLVQKCPSQLV
jgi:hypothetical protein